MSMPLLGPRFRKGRKPYGLNERQTHVREQILAHDQPADWEQANCLCGEVSGLLVSEIDRYGLPYRKLLCKRCGLMRASPRWTSARSAAFYQHDYRALYAPMSKEALFDAVLCSEQARDISGWIADVVARSSAKEAPTIVEIGAGGGWNLALLPTSWRRIGFDVDAEYLEMGRTKAKLEMRQGLLEDALKDPVVADADFILLSHVVEHFAFPVAELRKIRETMREDAILLIEVPGAFTIHRRLRDPMRYLQSAHTFSFCGQTLMDACEQAGLGVVELDETVRAVCRREPIGPRARARTRRRLATRLAPYLTLCEVGFRLESRLSRLPFPGKPLGLLVRHAWALLAESLFVPPDNTSELR